MGERPLAIVVKQAPVSIELIDECHQDHLKVSPTRVYQKTAVGEDLFIEGIPKRVSGQDHKKERASDTGKCKLSECSREGSRERT